VAPSIHKSYHLYQKELHLKDTEKAQVKCYGTCP
jgi:hypothetical protein